MGNRKTTACVLSIIALACISNPLGASSSRDPYQRIAERNMFDLRLVTEPQPPPPPPMPMPSIWLNGITDILGKKQVLMKVRFPPKPSAPPVEESYILTEGQREGDIEILAIDVKAGTVRVKIIDTIMDLSLEANGVKLDSMPSNAAVVQPAPPAFTPPPFPPLPARKISPNMLRLPPG